MFYVFKLYIKWGFTKSSVSIYTFFSYENIWILIVAIITRNIIVN